MKVTKVEKNQPREVSFGDVKNGSAFLSNGALYLKIGAERAVGLTHGTEGSLCPSKTVGVVEAEIRYSEVLEEVIKD